MIDPKLQKIADKTYKNIAEFLDVPFPEKVRLELSEECEYESDISSSDDHFIITLRVTDEPLDMFYNIAFWARRLYQQFNIPEYKGIRSLDEFKDINEYNSQPEMIDAYAFAAILMELIFNVGNPPLEGTSIEYMGKLEGKMIDLGSDYLQRTDFENLRMKFQNYPLFEIYRESAEKYQ